MPKGLVVRNKECSACSQLSVEPQLLYGRFYARIVRFAKGQLAVCVVLFMVPWENRKGDEFVWARTAYHYTKCKHVCLIVYPTQTFLRALAPRWLNVRDLAAQSHLRTYRCFNT